MWCLPECDWSPLRMFPHRMRGYLVVFATFLLWMSMGIELCAGTIFSYEMSYLMVRRGVDISNGALVWITATRFACQAISLPFSGMIERTIGTWKTAALGAVLLTASQLLTWWGCGYALTMFATMGVMQGVSQGIQIRLLVSLATSWFPTHRGFVTGITTAGNNVGGVLANLILTFYINPRNRGTSKFGNGHYFTDSALLDRVPYSFAVTALYTLIIQLIALPFVEKQPQQYEELHNSSQDDIEKSGARSHPKTSLKSRIFSLVRDESFCLLWLTYFTRTGISVVMTTYFKLFGLVLTQDDQLLGIVAALSAFASMVGKVSLGKIVDHYPWTATIAGVSALASFSFSAYGLSRFTGVATYIVWTLCLFYVQGAYLPTVYTPTHDIFGAEDYATNLGLVLSSGAPGAVVMAGISTACLSTIEYTGLFYVMACIALVPMLYSMILSIRHIRQRKDFDVRDLRRTGVLEEKQRLAATFQTSKGDSFSIAK